MLVFSSFNPTYEIIKVSGIRQQNHDVREHTFFVQSPKILAGLKFKKDLIRQLFREGMMRESVIYQEILALRRKTRRKTRTASGGTDAYPSITNSTGGRIVTRNAIAC
jgi:hypothetical protein